MSCWNNREAKKLLSRSDSRVNFEHKVLLLLDFRDGLEHVHDAQHCAAVGAPIVQMGGPFLGVIEQHATCKEGNSDIRGGHKATSCLLCSAPLWELTLRLLPGSAGAAAGFPPAPCAGLCWRPGRCCCQPRGAERDWHSTRAASATSPSPGAWEGTQLTHTGHRDVPHHMTIKGEGGVGTFVTEVWLCTDWGLASWEMARHQHWTENREWIFCFPLLLLMALALSDCLYLHLWISFHLVSPHPHPADEGSDREAWRAPVIHLGSTHHSFSLLNFSNPDVHLNLHLTQPRTVKGKVRSIWPALICSSMTHICIQLSWLQIICGWAKNMAYSVTHTEIHYAPSFKWTICTNSHFIQLL